MTSRASGRLGLALLGAAVAAWGLAPRRYVQPFGDGLEPSPVAPLAPAVVALFLGFLLSNQMSALERPPNRRLFLSRASWAALLLGLAVLAAASAAAQVASEWRTPMLRNAGGLAGLSFVGAVIFGARLAWVPPFCVVALTFAAGRDPNTGAPEPWALLLTPSASTTAAVAATGLVLAGIAGYTWRDSRPGRGILGE